MVNSVISREFIGRFTISYKKGEDIYAYDELTGGLYKINLDSRNIDLVISPKKIHKGSFEIIKGISISGNEIILVPFSLNSEWIFYDVDTEEIRYEFLFRDKICISSTITIGTNLFLIPSNVYNPIVILSLSELKIIKIYEKWFTQNRKKDNEACFGIWGASSFNDLVVFPIVNSNCIVCVNMKDITVITFDIPCPILSISIYKDKIWVLPTSGEYIYMSNLKGEILDRVNLSQIGLTASANEFVKIIAVEGMFLLLPIYKKDICIFQYEKKQVVQIETKQKFLRGRLFLWELTPYWDFLIEDEMLHMLPCDCRYIRIDMHLLKNEEYDFYYGKNIDYIEYWKMIGNTHKNYIFEKKKNELEDFFQYVFCLGKGDFTERDNKIGEKILKTIFLKD